VLVQEWLVRVLRASRRAPVREWLVREWLVLVPRASLRAPVLVRE